MIRIWNRQQRIYKRVEFVSRSGDFVIVREGSEQFTILIDDVDPQDRHLCK